MVELPCFCANLCLVVTNCRWAVQAKGAAHDENALISEMVVVQGLPLTAWQRLAAAFHCTKSAERMGREDGFFVRGHQGHKSFSG